MRRRALIVAAQPKTPSARPRIFFCKSRLDHIRHRNLSISERGAHAPNTGLISQEVVGVSGRHVVLLCQALLLACAEIASSGCSLLIEVGQPQCETTLTCEQQGFLQSECIDGLCERIANSTCDNRDACEGEEVCLDGHCQPFGTECKASDGCAIGQRCEDGYCMGEAAPEWACLRDTPSLDESDSPVRVSVPTLWVLDFTVRLTDLHARLCATVDKGCSSPLQEEIATNDEGVFEVELPPQFAGYLEIDQEQYAPTLYFFPTNRWDGAVLPQVLILPTAVGRNVLGDLIDIADPSRGHAMVTALDCLGQRAPGIVASASTADTKTVPYFVTDTPVRNLTETVKGRGIAGFANLPVGPTIIAISLKSTGQTLLQGTALVRPDIMTQMSFVPVPAAE